jgi:superfamily I DNA/RNA helicase
VKILRKNYRNSKQILDSAHGMLKNFVADVERPDHCGREGVSIKTFYYEGKEKYIKLKGIIDYFNIKEDVKLSDIAVFTSSNKKTLAKNLDKLEIAYKDVSLPNKDNKDSIKISTLHSAKGLEFRVVVIIIPQSKLLYDSEKDDVLKQQERAKLLYVGMTRAYDVCCFLLNKGNENGLVLDKVFNPVKRIRRK